MTCIVILDSRRRAWFAMRSRKDLPFHELLYCGIVYLTIDNSVSSPQLEYHCLFVNILLYVIVFGYVCLLNCLYICFNCSLIDDRSLFGLYFNKNYLLTCRFYFFACNIVQYHIIKNLECSLIIRGNWLHLIASQFNQYIQLKTSILPKN
jgi:hypothetical protein